MYPDARNLIYTLNTVNVLAEGQRALEILRSAGFVLDKNIMK